MEPTTRQVIVEGTLVPLLPPLVPIEPPVQPPLIPIEPPAPPTSPPAPYFSVGEASGAPGSTVMIDVEAGCLEPMTGFHIGGGCGVTSAERSGYGKFRAIGARLGPYLRDHLKAEDAIHDEPGHVHDHYFSKFVFVQWEPQAALPQAALPEVWWEFFVGFFSLDQERGIPAITIPSGTLLFTLELEILATTKPGEYLLTMRDEYYYTSSHQRRRDFTFTGPGQGYTALETYEGKLTVA